MSKKSMIRFDSSDWDTIIDTINKINEIGELQVGKTSDDETIIFDVQDDHTLITEVYQHNGWVRKTYYDVEDMTVETLYRKES